MVPYTYDTKWFSNYLSAYFSPIEIYYKTPSLFSLGVKLWCGVGDCEGHLLSLTCAQYQVLFSAGLLYGGDIVCGWFYPQVNRRVTQSWRRHAIQV